MFLPLASVMLLACADGAGDSGDPCRDATPTTYDDFGEDFMEETCQGCHGSDSDYRYGAPEDVTFDTLDQIWDRADRIVDRAAPLDRAPSMPPSGGSTEEDRLRLRWWLLCGPEGS